MERKVNARFQPQVYCFWTGLIHSLINQLKQIYTSDLQISKRCKPVLLKVQQDSGIYVVISLVFLFWRNFVQISTRHIIPYIHRLHAIMLSKHLRKVYVTMSIVFCINFVELWTRIEVFGGTQLNSRERKVNDDGTNVALLFCPWDPCNACAT